MLLDIFYMGLSNCNNEYYVLVTARKAWEKVWSDQKSGEIKRAFTKDYESTVPSEYTKDGKAHCYLYIALQ